MNDLRDLAEALPTPEELQESLFEEVNEWANKNLVGGHLPISEVCERLAAHARELFGQEVSIVNPRMEGTTLVADGFRLHPPVKMVHINNKIGKIS